MKLKIIYTILFSMAAFSIMMPKKLSKAEIYSTSLFSIFFGKTVDEILDIKKNLYGFYTKGVNYKGVFFQLLIYPTVNLLFLNYYPFERKRFYPFFYILGWSIFSILFELMSKETRFFYYKKWRLRYSAIIYPFLFITLMLNLKFVRKLMNTPAASYQSGTRGQ